MQNICKSGDLRDPAPGRDRFIPRRVPDCLIRRLSVVGRVGEEGIRDRAERQQTRSIALLASKKSLVVDQRPHNRRIAHSGRCLGKLRDDHGIDEPIFHQHARALCADFGRVRVIPAGDYGSDLYPMPAERCCPVAGSCRRGSIAAIQAQAGQIMEARYTGLLTRMLYRQLGTRDPRRIVAHFRFSITTDTDPQGSGAGARVLFCPTPQPRMTGSVEREKSRKV